MSKVLKSERREHPRIAKELPLNVAANGYYFKTTTQNVSCVGAYCRIAKYIPPFTKVNVKLALPVKKADKKLDYNVECKGVLVRTEDEPGGGFNIAIFFNEIKDDQRKKISAYINQFIPTNETLPSKRI